MRTTTTACPRIYVACLAAYNSGILHGSWVDATLDLNDIWAAIINVIATSPVEDSEEWALHDYENFGNLSLGESENIEYVHEIALFIEEHEAYGRELLAHFNGNLADANNALENYYGEYDSLTHYVRELTEDTTEIPANLEPYIDYESMARDIDLNGELFTIQSDWNKVHVFAS